MDVDIFHFVRLLKIFLSHLIISKMCPQPLVLDHHDQEEDGEDHREADQHDLGGKRQRNQKNQTEMVADISTT